MDILLPVLFSFALAAPLVAFVLALVWRTPQGNSAVQGVLMASAVSGAIALAMLFMSNTQTVNLLPALNIGITVGGLAPFFLLLIYIGTFLTSLFAVDYVRRYADIYKPHWLNAASAIFIFGMQATVLSGTVVGFLLSWEIMSLAAYLLVIADRSSESMRAGFLYLIMTHVGFLALCAGFLILSNGDPWATWGALANAAQTLPFGYITAAFFLLFAGFGSKAGLVPLHQWLPYAHPQAPSHSSALLSGVMLKVALFGFIQSLSLFPFISPWWALAVIAVGLVSAFFGVLNAAVESDIKRMLAWSSIENMGIIFSAVGALLAVLPYVPSPLAIVLVNSFGFFVILHSLNHMFFKTGLFMTAGAIGAMAHTRDLNQLGGLAQKWPLLSVAALFLALGAAAIPPLGTFFGEWLYLQTLASALPALPLVFAIVAVCMLAILGLVAGLAVFTFVNFYSTAFLGRARSHHAEEAGAMPGLLVASPVLCAALLFLVGPVIPFIHGNVPGDLTLTVVPSAAINPPYIVLMAVVAGMMLFAIYRLVSSRIRITDTWNCGQPITPRMQYTATGFAAPIRFFFRSLVLARKRVIVEPIFPDNPWIARRRLEWSVASFWEEWLYRPIGYAVMRGASVMQRLQSGVVQVYILLVVIALIVTMFFAL
jgi:hydrogenase-4 component B